MADRAREKGRTERYLPKSAWASMSKEERRATDEKKKRATRGKRRGEMSKQTRAKTRAKKYKIERERGKKDERNTSDRDWWIQKNNTKNSPKWASLLLSV